MATGSACRSDDPPLRSLLIVAERSWMDRVIAGSLAPDTMRLYKNTATRFARFAVAHGVLTASGIDRPLCAGFVLAGIAGQGATDGRRGRPPAPQTSQIRLIALRGLWAAAVQEGLCKGDEPTLGLQIRRCPARDLNPLTPPEVSALRLRGRCTAEDTLRPVQVELALAGASQVEIANVRVADVDLGAWRVNLLSRRDGARQVHLEGLARPAVRARLAQLSRTYRSSLGPLSSHPLALDHPVDHYAAGSLSPMVASSLRRALDAALITRLGVSPISILQYAANAAYAVTGRVEDVADLLGRRSLDAAARLVAPHWQAAWAEHVRADHAPSGGVGQGCA